MPTVAETSTSTRFMILGTAGHIDHGKSTLVRALTGIDPDRLPEEKARGMTIDLGFAHLDLPGVRVGIVDVPGHERFVKTMVAGATGIDAALLVVAADDGPMPQTREHIEILDLLGVTVGLIVVSKADLVDAERVAAVTRDVLREAAGTSIARWPSVAVSATRGDGLDELRTRTRELAARVETRATSSVFVMPIDRVFTKHGRGTVVTGSVACGSAEIGQTLHLMPAEIPVRIRELQSYGAAARSAQVGRRAAINISGVDRVSPGRGDVLATPGYLTPTRYVDVRVRLVSQRSKPLGSHRRVRVAFGTREEMAVLVCVEGAAVPPGDGAFVQLRFAKPVVVRFGERMILRDETACETIGGAVVLRVVSRRIRPARAAINALRALESADAIVRIREVLRSAGFRRNAALELACAAGVEPGEVPTLLDALRGAGELRRVGAFEVDRHVVDDVRSRALTYVKRHHARTPTEPGVLSDRFVGWLDRRSAAGLGRFLLQELIDAGELVARGPYVAHREFRPALSAEDQALAERLVAEIAAAGLDPPEWSKLRVLAGLSRQRAAMLLELARSEPRLVQIGPEEFVERRHLDRLKDVVREVGRGGRRFRLAEVRDALALSRRSVLPLLEYLDRTRFTRRIEDMRVLAESAS